ncbi:MAG TPA: hypothetical protein PLK94_06540, partial [Alphaproteobacteria bacterium]|nr:hypothetical protein [Alphaproteobacteria bacterium]
MSRANKKSIASALMIGYLGCTALVMPSNPAFAAQTVSAKSSWSVSRVASIAQGNYCTMAQKYDNNAILSFARSVNGEYSLAMDFQSPVFSGSEENISVQAGNGQSSTYKVTPQSQQVAVISLGRDEEFFKALESSQKLNIKFSGADLSFKTDRFKDGKSELVTCLSGLNKPAASATEQTAQAPSPSPSSSKTDSYSVEGLLAARPNPSMGAEPISSLETSAPVAKVEA